MFGHPIKGRALALRLEASEVCSTEWRVGGAPAGAQVVLAARGSLDHLRLNPEHDLIRIGSDVWECGATGRSGRFRSPVVKVRIPTTFRSALRNANMATNSGPGALLLDQCIGDDGRCVGEERHRRR